MIPSIYHKIMQVNKKVQLSCRKVLTPRISSDNIHLRCETSKLREAGDQMTKQERIKRLSEAIEAVPEEKFADEAEQKAG